MADSIKIGNLDISAFKVGGADCSIYLGDTLLYPQSPTPTGSTCYEVISTPITSYTSTTYDSVYSFTDAKWYMKNNLSQYEEYGIYDVVSDIASATTYEGKLAVVGTTEYQYSGGSWSVVGSYVDSSVTYTIDNTDPSPYVGQELATTFKIPYADVESIGWVDLRIRGNGGGELFIRLDTGGMADYGYEGSGSYNGTVTNDGEYFYLSLPSEAPQSIVINSIDYWNSTPIHLIVGSKQATVQYEEKDIPLGNVYDTVTEMELDVCPTVGISQYGVVGNNVYKFSNNEEWNTVSSVKFVGKYNDGLANVIECGSSSSLFANETKPSYITSQMTTASIGNCVTSINQSAFDGCSGLTSVTISDSVTSIGQSAFRNCSGLTSIDIPSGVISIGNSAFYYCRSLTSVTIPSGVTSINQSAFNSCSSLTSIVIPSGVTIIGFSAFDSCSGLTSIDIPSGVTSIGSYAFASCKSLTSITVNAVTPPTLGSNAFNNTPIANGNGYIYVPSGSVNVYKSATNWKTYASRIQSIPNS